MASLVQNIRIYALDESTLSIEWIKPENPKIEKLALYKSNTSLTSSDLYLQSPLLILDASQESFIDSIENLDIENETWNQKYLTYFYYLISIDNSKEGEIIPLLIPGTNFTIFVEQKETRMLSQAIEIEKKKIVQNTNNREIYPLPRKNILETQIPDENNISNKENLLKILNSHEKKVFLTDIQIFDEDLEAKAGEAYLLADILKKYFVLSSFSKTEEEINSFLMIHRSQDIRYKTIFYLAQALYFQEKYVEALFYFIECQNYLFDISRDWIDSCLDVLSE